MVAEIKGSGDARGLDTGDEGRRVVIVSAAAGTGIGSAVARQLADEGMDVVVTDRHERRCSEVAQELSDHYGRDFLGMVVDVRDVDAVERAVRATVERFGRIDSLVNNAGWNKLKTIAEMDEDTWNTCLDINLNGTFRFIRAVLPIMMHQGSGSIINISSVSAWLAERGHGPYAAAKAGVQALTRVVAGEVGGNGVRVNAIAPGLIYNEFLDRVYPPGFFAESAGRNMLGRLGTPQDVANLVSFLLSDKAGFITGEVYGIAGGEWVHA